MKEVITINIDMLGKIENIFCFLISMKNEKLCLLLCEKKSDFYIGNSEISVCWKAFTVLKKKTLCLVLKIVLEDIGNLSRFINILFINLNLFIGEWNNCLQFAEHMWDYINKDRALQIEITCESIILNVWFLFQW